MTERRRGRPSRRQILVLFAMSAAAVAARVSVWSRFRFVLNTAIDFLYAAFGPRAPLHVAATHQIQYLLSLPQGVRTPSAATTGQPRALVITIDGADHDFRGYHAAFVRARRDLPFVVVTPFVVSNGGRRNPRDYPYSANLLNTATSDPLGFDVTGVSAIIHDMRDRFGAALPVYLTGFSAGGHLAWLLVLTHPDWLAGAALASANFAGRGLTPNGPQASTTRVPVRAFVGAADRLSDVLLAQWDCARTLAQQRGCRDLAHVVVPGAGHSPFAREVLGYFTDLALATPR